MACSSAAGVDIAWLHASVGLVLMMAGMLRN
jgi:hypothetical protein